MPLPEFAIIIPACDEAACIGAVLDEFLATVDPEKFVIAVGVNGSSDATAQIARQRPVLVAETERRGYGHGCQAAIDLTNNLFPAIRAYVFCAGDGATDPRDLRSLVAAFEQGYDFVLGSRTKRVRNWRTMTLRHLVANAALGLWCGLARWAALQRSWSVAHDQPALVRKDCAAGNDFWLDDRSANRRRPAPRRDL